MTSRRSLFILAGSALAGLSALPPSAEAQPVIIDRAPPPPRPERLPPRRGYVAIPGHWRWQGGRHVWNRGRHERERRGYGDAQPGWRQDGDRYRFGGGGWRRG